MLAAQNGHVEVVKYLVQGAGADKDKEDKVSVVSLPLLATWIYLVCYCIRLVCWCVYVSVRLLL
jgi:hypothetical protein